MDKKLSRNAMCPCGSGKKYKHCCINKDFNWVESKDGTIGRRIPLSPEVSGILERWHDNYVANHGREPERLFEDAPHAELLEHWTVEAMKKGGVEPALIYAYEKTDGLMLSTENENKVPDVDVALWDAAIDEYERTSGRKASKRRLTEEDCEAIIRNGPKQRGKTEFVQRLPIPPPFDRDAWSEKRLSQLVEDPEMFEYFQQCIDEVRRSGRTDHYLMVFLMLASFDEIPEDESEYENALNTIRDRAISVDDLERTLDIILQGFGPKGTVPTAAAAFEFLSFVGDFVGQYAEHQGVASRLERGLAGVHGLALAAFAAAVNYELGIREDIWR